MLCHVCACARAHALAVGMRCAISFVCCLPSKRCYMFHVCIPNPHPQTIRIFHFVFGSGFFFLRLFCSFRFQCRNKNMRVWFWAKFLRFPSTLADFVWMIFASQFTIIFLSAFVHTVSWLCRFLAIAIIIAITTAMLPGTERAARASALIFARSRSSSGDERHQIDTNIFRKKIFSFCFATHFSHWKFFMFICFFSLPPSLPLCLSFFVRALFVSRFYRNKIMFMFSLIWFNIYFLCWKLYEVTGCSWAAFVYDLVFENAKESLLSE